MYTYLGCPQNEVKSQHDDWVAALIIGNEPSVCDLATVIFVLYFSKDRLEAMVVGTDHEAKITAKKTA